MGSDLYMEAHNGRCNHPPLDEQVRNLIEERDTLQERLSAVIAEKSRLEAQARQDADTIVRLTRERDGAYAGAVSLTRTDGDIDLVGSNPA